MGEEDAQAQTCTSALLKGGAMPVAHHLAAGTEHGDQGDCGGHRLLSRLDSHVGASLQ